MFNPDGANQLQGENLRRLVEEVRREFFIRGAREIGDGYEQVNSARVVTVEVYCRLSIDAQIAIAADLMRATEEIVFNRDAEDIFGRSDTPQSHITDLICEVIYQELMNDPQVMMEDESREALSE